MANKIDNVNVIAECTQLVTQVLSVARRVEFVQLSQSTSASLVLCPRHLQRFFRTYSKCRLTGEIFPAAQCDWCHPESS